MYEIGQFGTPAREDVRRALARLEAARARSEREFRSAGMDGPVPLRDAMRHSLVMMGEEIDRLRRLLAD